MDQDETPTSKTLPCPPGGDDILEKALGWLLTRPDFHKFLVEQDEPEHWLAEVAFGRTTAFSGGRKRLEAIIQLAHTIGWPQKDSCN